MEAPLILWKITVINILIYSAALCLAVFLLTLIRSFVRNRGAKVWLSPECRTRKEKIILRTSLLLSLLITGVAVIMRFT